MQHADITAEACAWRAGLGRVKCYVNAKTHGVLVGEAVVALPPGPVTTAGYVDVLKAQTPPGYVFVAAILFNQATHSACNLMAALYQAKAWTLCAVCARVDGSTNTSGLHSHKPSNGLLILAFASRGDCNPHIVKRLGMLEMPGLCRVANPWSDAALWKNKSNAQLLPDAGADPAVRTLHKPEAAVAPFTTLNKTWYTTRHRTRAGRTVCYVCYTTRQMTFRYDDRRQQFVEEDIEWRELLRIRPQLQPTVLPSPL